jgi:predicted lipoprotein with Yx(FWY)xxD motif
MLARALAGILLVPLVLAACGGSATQPATPGESAAAGTTETAPAPPSATSVAVAAPTTEAATTAEPPPPQPTLKVASSLFGKTIADRHGEALYLFDADSAGTATCYGACAKAWPPLLTKRKPTVRDPLEQALVGTTKRRDGTRQVTYNGHPLYYYVADEPGVIRCQNVAEYGGQWLIVKPNGRANRAR